MSRDDQQTRYSGLTGSRPEQACAIPATRERSTLQEQHSARSRLRLLPLSVLVLALGCGQQGGLPLASMEGTVAYQGKLLDHGKVVFTPQASTPGPPAVGEIQPDGSYVMRTTGRDGAAVGAHKVTVHCRRKLTPEEIRNRSLVTPKSLIPDKYWIQKESPLTFDVAAGELNVYNITLE
jgi:hypothetical protein